MWRDKRALPSNGPLQLNVPHELYPDDAFKKGKSKTIFTKSTGFLIGWSAPTGYATVKAHAFRHCPSATGCSGFAPFHRWSNIVLFFISTDWLYIALARYKNKTVSIVMRPSLERWSDRQCWGMSSGGRLRVRDRCWRSCIRLPGGFCPQAGGVLKQVPQIEPSSRRYHCHLDGKDSHDHRCLLICWNPAQDFSQSSHAPPVAESRVGLAEAPGAAETLWASDSRWAALVKGVAPLVAECSSLEIWQEDTFGHSSKALFWVCRYGSPVVREDWRRRRWAHELQTAIRLQR